MQCFSTSPECCSTDSEDLPLSFKPEVSGKKETAYHENGRMTDHWSENLMRPCASSRTALSTAQDYTVHPSPSLLVVLCSLMPVDVELSTQQIVVNVNICAKRRSLPTHRVRIFENVFSVPSLGISAKERLATIGYEPRKHQRLKDKEAPKPAGSALMTPALSPRITSHTICPPRLADEYPAGMEEEIVLEFCRFWTRSIVFLSHAGKDIILTVGLLHSTW
ncbi:hypothetical protein C8Q75DRAFT_732767 [Abortiporus biennis]|nr:hypothetical protein C8Q75DRAFT_732767 [Abortiporus biennis]